MFKEKYQSKLFTILNSSGSGPLDGWITKRGYGSIEPVKDGELKTHVVDILSPNVATTFISSPPPPHTSLGLALRCLTMQIKYFEQPFSFEVQILDDEGMRRRLRFSTYNREMRLTTFLMSAGLALVPGWNIVQLDLAELTSRAYGSMYLDTLKVAIHANCRLRRVYFSDKLYSDTDLPPDYRLLVAPARKKEFNPILKNCSTISLNLTNEL